MTTDQNAIIREYLKNFVNLSYNPHFAVLIEGGWGCGKTHFCNSLIKDEGFTEKNCLYLSLFGVESVESFQTQLFFASASKGAKLGRYAASLLSSAVKGTLRLDLDGDSSSETAITGGIPDPKGWIEKACTNLDNAVLILDDLERCKIDLNALLGAINQLVEHGNARVILIANKGKIRDQERLQDLYDKLIGQSFELTAQPDKALESFVSDIDDKKIRPHLKNHLLQIIKLHQQSGYKNLRILRQFIGFLYQLLSKLDGDILSRKDLIEKLVEQAFIFFVEFKHDLGEESKQLSIDDLGGNDDKERLVIDVSAFGEGDETAKSKISTKYDAWHGIETVITVNLWIVILKTGVIKQDELNDEIRQSSLFNGFDSWPSWRRLYHLRTWNFSDGSHDQFEKDLADMQAGLKEKRYKNPLEFLHVAGVMLMLSEYDLIDENLEQVVNKMQRYMYNNLVFEFSHEFESIIDEGLEGYDGLGYQNNNEYFIKIKNHFFDCYDSQKEKWLKSKAGLELLETMKNDFKVFASQMSLESTSYDRRFREQAILHILPADVFVNAWLSLELNNQFSLPPILQSRYRFDQHLIKEEKGWCEKVLTELKSACEREIIRPRKAQINMLCKDFQGYVISYLKD